MKQAFAYLNRTLRAKTSTLHSTYFNTSRLRCSVFIPNRTIQLNKSGGFTLVELMIASAVFSVVLLVITAGLLQIGRVYYRGVSSARVQEVARGVADDVAHTLQMSGGTVLTTGAMPVNGNVRGICVGTQRYSYVLGGQIPTDYKHAFVADTVTSGCAAGPGGTQTMTQAQMDALNGGARELLGDRMRLVDLQLTQDADPANSRMYHIKVRVAYGDDDLLCSPGLANDCNVTGTSPSMALATPPADLICKTAKAGTQYCAISEIVTTVVKRL